MRKTLQSKAGQQILTERKEKISKKLQQIRDIELKLAGRILFTKWLKQVKIR